MIRIHESHIFVLRKKKKVKCDDLHLLKILCIIVLIFYSIAYTTDISGMMFEE